MVDGNKETTLGLGERLRSARKARALTLQQAAFTLRLEESVLRALEDERYEVLGAAVFVRGHLKAYARLLGLSEEAILAAYRTSDPSADAPPRVTRELEKPLTTTPGPLAILAAVGFALLAILLVYMLGAGDGPAPVSIEPAPANDAVSTVDMLPVLPSAGTQEFQPLPVTPAATPAATPAGDEPGDETLQAPAQSMPEPPAETPAAPVAAPPATGE
ncbi:MAG: helix-turn-helix domain-containing protein [Gammaproteobacteria bacterium]|nr:helix-turn-helix domain-containing protein [Gammaproteobacteria bacterium]